MDHRRSTVVTVLRWMSMATMLVVSSFAVWMLRLFVIALRAPEQVHRTPAWQVMVWAVVALAIMVTVHEAAHVVAGVLCGLTFAEFVPGWTPAVRMVGRRTWRIQLAVSLAGPLAAGVLGVVLLLAAAPWGPVWTAGLVGLLSSADLMIWTRGADGGKALRSALWMARGQGHEVCSD